MQIIDALSTCVRHVGSFEEAPDLDAIRSLPTCILKVLRETFQHCKVSLFRSIVAVMSTSEVILNPYCTFYAFYACCAVITVNTAEYFDGHVGHYY